MKKGDSAVSILAEAEKAGVRYNVPKGEISRSLTYIGEVEIINGDGWLYREGSDTEDDESLRGRCLRSWSELALVPIHDTYINICEAIAGVLAVTVDDQHPREQGTVDIHVVSEAGLATEALLQEVRAACESVRLPDDDVLVKSAEVVTQPIALIVTIIGGASRDGLTKRVQDSVYDLLRLRRNEGREFNELTHADIVFRVKSDCAIVRNVTVTTPYKDIFFDKNMIIVPGEVTVTIEGV